MSNVFTLDSLRDEIEREYAPLTMEAGGEEFVLRQVLRCDKKDRDQVLTRLRDLNVSAKDEDNEDPEKAEVVFAAARFIISVVTADKKGAKLVKLIGDDDLLLMKVLEKWMEVTQPGEAQPSPN